MAWTAPRTWVAGEVLTAALLNTHVRDNLLETGAAKVTTAEDILVATGANALKRLAVGTEGQALSVVSGDVAWANLITPGWVRHSVGTLASSEIAFTGLSTSIKGWRVTGVLLGVSTPVFALGGGATLVGGTWYADATGTLSHSTTKDAEIGDVTNLDMAGFVLTILKDGTGQGFYILTVASDNSSTNAPRFYETRGMVNGNAITSITLSGSLDAGSFAILEQLNTS